MIFLHKGKKARAYQEAAITKNKFRFQSCSSLKELLLNTSYFCSPVKKNTLPRVKLTGKTTIILLCFPMSTQAKQKLAQLLAETAVN